MNTPSDLSRSAVHDVCAPSGERHPYERLLRGRWSRMAAMLVGVALLAACGGGQAHEQARSEGLEQQTGAEEGGEFPRTVEVPSGEHGPAVSLDIPERPERVVTLTYETTELVSALGAGEALVMVPEASANPVLSRYAEANAEVAAHFPSESSIDAETVLAQQPDLVLLSARHGLETGVGQAISAAGVPVLVLPNTWRTYDDMAQNIELAGRALGADATAEVLIEELAASDVLGVEADLDGDEPAILVLSNQAGRPFVVGGSAFPLGLIELAGARDAGAASGLDRTGPISVEQVVAAAPDGILLIDMNGSGRASFGELLGSPAAAGVPAVSEGRVELMEAKEVQALGLVGTTESVEYLRGWIEDLSGR